MHHDHADQTLQEPCLPCTPQTPLRNHYFFGKLMDVPDFEVEQAYMVEKFKRHHARLHGTGVVCGLEVLPHPNPACRDTHVVVSPGTALDCCGQEILVLHEQVLELMSFPAFAALVHEPDDRDHLLRLSICYRECATEEVPVLYDECGCEDTRCAPNRILESWRFELEVDPVLPPPTGAPQPPMLHWRGTIAAPGLQTMALHPGTTRAYLGSELAAGAGLVQQLHLQTQAPLAPKTFPTPVRGVAASEDGAHLAVVLQGAAAADPLQLALLNTTTPAAFAGAVLSQLPMPGTAGATRVGLLTLSGQRWVSWAARPGQTLVQRWHLGAGNVLVAQGQVLINAEAMDAAWRSDGHTLLLAPAAGNWQAVDVSAAALAAVALPVAGNGLRCIAVASSSAAATPDLLAWCEGAGPGSTLKLARLDASPVGQAQLAGVVNKLLIEPGAQTAYVMQQDAAGAGSVVAVDLLAMRASKSPLQSAPVAVGNGSRGLALNGDQLWAATAQHVALLDLEFGHCLAWLEPQDCPDCSDANCVTLATFQNWQPGRRLESPTETPSDPMADRNAGIVRIDMLSHRVVVPSVSALAAAVRCLLQRGCGCIDSGGGTGEVGPAGPTGPAGPGIDQVQVIQRPCNAPLAAPTLNGPPGARVLRLEVNRGCDGQPGVGTPGADLVFDWALPHICDISWEHGGRMALNAERELTLVLSFDTLVLAADLRPEAIRLQVRRPDPQLGDLLQCWCDLNLTERIDSGLTEPCNAREFRSSGDAEVNAVRLRVGSLDRLLELQRNRALELRLLVNGDFIRGRHAKTGEWRALDADHIPKLDPPSPPGAPQPGVTPGWLAPRDGRLSGDGIEGGTFESWFTLVRG
jgi:hypothetical protein